MGIALVTAPWLLQVRRRPWRLMHAVLHGLVLGLLALSSPATAGEEILSSCSVGRVWNIPDELGVLSFSEVLERVLISYGNRCSRSEQLEADKAHTLWVSLTVGWGRAC